MNSFENESSSLPIQTETMAQLLLNQRHWREAIDIYHILGQQNPEKAAEYQKKIIEIKEYFKPQLSPESSRKIKQTHSQINHLRKLLQVVKNQQV